MIAGTRTTWLVALTIIAMWASSCSSREASSIVSNSTEATELPTSSERPRAAPAAESTSDVPATTEQQNTVPTNHVPTAPAATQPERSCVRLTDFATEAEHAAWFIVNDNVMGGQSNGGISFGETEMIFAGSINTDGGGFSSVRALLGPGALEGGTYLVARVRGDQRPYRFTLSDELDGRDPRISHQGLIELGETDDWQEAWVPLSDLSASLFGRSVDTPPFDLTSANEIGIILSDVVDGPFSLEVDWIDVCS